MIDKMYNDLQFYKITRVGRKHLTDYEMWKEWIKL